MKYKDCTSLADMSNVNSNYLEEDIDDGCWFYQLPSLVNGDNMFYNDTMTELYEGRSPLWHFEANLQSLQSGVNMFKRCWLDAVSVKRIADTLPNTSTGTITLGIHYSLEGDSGVAASLAKIESKGWSVETEYNLPYGFTELEYLESSGTQWIDTGVTTPTNTWMSAKVYLVSHWGAYPQVYGTKNRLADGTGDEFYDMAVNGARGYIIRPNFTPNWETVEGELTVEVTYRRLAVNGKVIGYGTQLQQDVNAVNNMYLFAGNNHNNGSNGKASEHSASRIWYFKLYNNAGILCDLIPVLDADGTPCMYDKVSRKCFYNSGKGTFGYRIKTADSESSTFSLRDPYYTAPSGVYARLAGENELDIIADTDMTEDVAEQEGYIWFANTGEAYDHFGITRQSEEGEVIEA